MEEIKKCPYCGKEIMSIAKKCRYCGRWVDGSDETQTSNNSMAINSQFDVIDYMHCGEWLDEEHKVIPEANNASYAEVPNSENKGNDGKIEVYSLDSPISPYAIILFYLAMLFCFVSMIQNMGLSHIGSRYDFVIEYCNYVPE